MLGFLGRIPRILMLVAALVVVVGVVHASRAVGQENLVAFWNRLRGDPYALDSIDRHVSPSAKLVCPDVELVTYRGDVVRYARPVTVAKAFVTKLKEFERVVSEVSIETYGRAPRRIEHRGAYVCRPVRGRSTRLSEHAIGNAIDIAGFQFGPARGEARKALSPPLRRAFDVRVGSHWRPSSEKGEVHARFLRRLADRLNEREVFRAMIGPDQPGHAGHFHFDSGPYSYVRF